MASRSDAAPARSTRAEPRAATRAPLTVVVLTFNEALNLPACLESVAGWAAEIVVVDSGSRDATCAIAAQFGARVVAHPFETHARQWHWALETVTFDQPWLLCLDADQSLTTELRDAIAAAVSGDADIDGYFVNRRQIFRGRWIRHGGYYPKYLLKLVRRAAVSVDPAELVDHHFIVGGKTGRLRGDLIEDNHNEASIAAWTDKHNRYAVLQAREEVSAARGAASAPAASARRRRFWRRLPLFVRPCGYVFYRYVLRLGFLDGKEGFIFHVLHAFWYRLLVDINIDELRRRDPETVVAVAEPGRLEVRQ